MAIVGANGQVGAELCLLLAGCKDIELIPICRNRSGSSFLRWQGVSCRHGRVADPADAARLLGDCDVVVNSSLATGTPSEIRRIEGAIVANIFRFSKPSATIIHFSTQSVYGDPRQNRRIRWRNPYGRAKLATERRVRMESRRTKKPAYVLRLGHVCGALQEISNTIRAAIRARSVILPARNHSSNTVYTTAIIGAIEQIVGGRMRPDTYDLMNSPRWSWHEVYEHEAEVCRTPLEIQRVDASHHAPVPAIFAPAARLLGSLIAAQSVRDLLAKFFAYLPGPLNARALAWWYARRARAQIAALAVPAQVAEHLSWVENGNFFFPSETDTITLLRSASQRQAPHRPSWPVDLADARNGFNTADSAGMPLASCQIPHE
jgi:dTDP-4-dehydrorhamnose reductase